MNFTEMMNKLLEIDTLRSTIGQMEDRRATIVATMNAQIKAIDTEIISLDRQLKKAAAKLTGGVEQ